MERVYFFIQNIYANCRIFASFFVFWERLIFGDGYNFEIKNTFFYFLKSLTTSTNKPLFYGEIENWTVLF